MKEIKDKIEEIDKKIAKLQEATEKEITELKKKKSIANTLKESCKNTFLKYKENIYLFIKEINCISESVNEIEYKGIYIHICENEVYKNIVHSDELEADNILDCKIITREEFLDVMYGDYKDVLTKTPKNG